MVDMLAVPGMAWRGRQPSGTMGHVKVGAKRILGAAPVQPSREPGLEEDPRSHAAPVVTVVCHLLRPGGRRASPGLLEGSSNEFGGGLG